MALKDLVTDHRQIAEETIEKIISPYIRYDAAAHKIVLTPQAKSLGNDAKVLVFLVAVLGWQYVLDESWNAPSKPADLEAELGITGGTLRPVLKKLKDAHLLIVVEGHYRVQPANLDSVELAIAGQMPKGTWKSPTRTAPRIARGKGGAQDDLDQTGDHQTGDQKLKKKRGASGQLKTLLTRWIIAGFFDEPRTLAALLERYHEHGVIAKQTSLSGLVLEAVREDHLMRTRAAVGGKQVWVYTARNA